MDPVEESKDYQIVEKKKSQKVRMGDFKRSPVVASPYQHLREMIESNISDHDPVLSGPPNPVIDLAKLSHDALVAKAKEVITVHNPTGRPPPGAEDNVPPMLELLDHLEDARRHSYASMDHSFGEQSSPSESVDSSVQEEAQKKKPRSYKEALTRPTMQLDMVSTSKSKPTKKAVSFTKVTQQQSRDWSFPPGRGEATRNKVAAMDKRDAEAAAAEKKAAALKRQYGETTQRLPTTVIPGKRNCPISIYGNYITGTKKLATIVKPKLAEISIDDDDSDETPTSEKEKQRRLNNRASAALLNDSLLPDSAFDIEASSSDDNKNQDKAKTPSFDMGALLPTAIANESDSEIELDPLAPVPRLELTLAERCVDDTKFLASSRHREEFHRYCPAMPPRVARFPHPKDDPDNPLLISLPGCPPLPPGVDAEHIMSAVEQELCACDNSKAKLIWSNWDYFHGVTSAKQLQADLVAMNKDRHHQIVLLGGAFTNSVWATNKTLHHDKQLFYDVITKHGQQQHGTFCPAFSEIPLGTVGLSFFLILPIPAILHYLNHHGIPLNSIPWTITRQDNGETMMSLPTATQPPFVEWMTFLLALLQFLHAAMVEKDLAYSIMHNQSLHDNMSALSNFDAYEFLTQHFPREAAALSNNDSIHESAALLQRASAFARSAKYRMDIQYKCSARWAVFLYYMVHNSYPIQYADATYDMDQCVARLLSCDIDQSRRLVDFPNLLTGNPRNMYALLNEHPLARKLYGAAVPSSAVGVHRLMIMGLVVKHVQLATKSKNVDSALPASFLSYIGYAGGVLSPCSPGEKPFQASALFPVLQMASAMQSIKSIIDSQNILLLVPPPGNIPVTYTNAQYHQHYERAQANSVISSAQYMTWTDRQRLVHPPPDFYDGECLFPTPPAASAAADAVPLDTDYVVTACQRMLAVCTQDALLTSFGETTRVPPKPRKPTTPASPQLQTTLRVTGDGVLASRTQRKSRETEPRSTSATITQAHGKSHRAQVITPRYNALLPIPSSSSFQPTTMLADWSIMDFGEVDFQLPYIRTISFQTVQSRSLMTRDKLVLLQHAQHYQHRSAPRHQHGFLQDYSHVVYTLKDHQGQGDRTQAYDAGLCYLDYDELLHAAPDTDHFEGSFAPRVTITINGAYILYEGPPTGPVQTSSQPPRTTLSDSESDDTEPKNPTSGRANDRRRKREHRATPSDSGSEDSAAKKMTKMSHITYRSSRIEVIGKTAHFERVQKTVALRNMSVDGHLAKILREVGVYGHTLEPKAIMDGLINNPPTDADFNMSNLGAAIDHNKHKLMQLTWYHHEELHENVVHVKFNMSHSMVLHSVHSCHFLTLADAVRTHYKILTYQDWINHIMGWKITWQELLGQPYGDCLQIIYTEIQNSQIGQHCNVAYLVALSDRWRAQVYHFASGGVVFSLEGSTLRWDPSTMKASDWVQLINFLWQEFKSNISVAKQLEYAHLQAAYQVKAPVPFGQKAKAVAPHVPLVGKGAQVINQNPPAMVEKAKNKKGGRTAKDKKEAKDKKPRSPAERDISVCVADLLQHYGASQRVVCASPCPYVHYKSVPQGTAKEAVLRTVKFLRKAFDLTEETIQLLKKKITTDPKFK